MYKTNLGLVSSCYLYIPPEEDMREEIVDSIVDECVCVHKQCSIAVIFI